MLRAESMDRIMDDEDTSAMESSVLIEKGSKNPATPFDDVLLFNTTTTATSTPLTATTRIGLRQRIPIKRSLQTYGTHQVLIDNPWLLTAISAGHYFLYPLGMCLAWFLFSHMTELQQHVTTSTSSSPLFSVFLILMGHLMNAWGSAMAGTLVHETEDWQIAQLAVVPMGENDANFNGNGANLLSGRVVDPSHSNNPQLYSVAFTMLLGAIAMGNLCIGAGVFDISNNIWMKGWAVFSIFGYFLANDEPFCTSFWYSLFAKSKFFRDTFVEKGWNQLTDHGRKQIFRVSAFKFHGIFLPNAMLCAAALVRLFGSSTSIPVWMAPLPLVLSSMGGIWEGIVAETTFDQRHHLVAIILIGGGYALYLPFYGALFSS
ncbi:hypothetical protein IV203_026812 [Nitzschia inconspicua]|uniref:Transmembrane protein n=1 Tax=Nitzschia inconspicua TaxID=303405 RepID=A0A9K3LJY2_9STRA|nr:hypothetical protein IV203_026812 [Nitzschia inconspicua]